MFVVLQIMQKNINRITKNLHFDFSGYTFVLKLTGIAEKLISILNSVQGIAIINAHINFQIYSSTLKVQNKSF